jgi:RimJ/RimL family protein N-acetyltransferase
MTNEKSDLGTKMIFESLFLIYSLAFKDLGLEKLHGVIAKSNVRMIKLQESLGMEIEGVLHKHNIINGDFEDLVLVSLFKKKFEDHSSILLQNLLYN